jgi:hypothetical protein
MAKAQNSGKVVSLMHRSPLPQEKLLVLILLEAESTPGQQCDRKYYVNGNHKNLVTIISETVEYTKIQCSI